MRARTAAAALLGLGGLAVGLALWAGELTASDSAVTLADASALTLDTVAVRGRRVEASLNGTVVEIGDDGRILLALADGAVELRLPEAGALRVEDRVLAVGRLRARRGRRYIEADAWVVVTGDARPPATAGL